MHRDDIVASVARAWLLLGDPEAPDIDAVVMDGGLLLWLVSRPVRDRFGAVVECVWELDDAEWDRLLATPDEVLHELAHCFDANPTHALDETAAACASFATTVHVDVRSKETHRTLRVVCRRCERWMVGSLRTSSDHGASRSARVESLKLAMLDRLRAHRCAGAACDEVSTREA